MDLIACHCATQQCDHRMRDCTQIAELCRWRPGRSFLSARGPRRAASMGTISMTPPLACSEHCSATLSCRGPECSDCSSTPPHQIAAPCTTKAMPQHPSPPPPDGCHNKTHCTRHTPGSNCWLPQYNTGREVSALADVMPGNTVQPHAHLQWQWQCTAHSPTHVLKTA